MSRSENIEEAFASLDQEELTEIFEAGSVDEKVVKRYLGSFCQLLSFLNVLRKQGEAGFCDVVLEVDGQSFPAHRCVLAANSQFFYTLFSSGMRDSNEKHVNLRCLSSSSVSTILDFFYERFIVINKDNVEELLEAASFLLLNHVKKACAEVITKNLSISNCFSVKRLAERYTLEKLVKKADLFIKENFQEARQQKEFLELEPSLLKELISCDSVKVEREEEVFSAVINWVKHDPTNRAKELSTLLPCLRYGSLSPEFIEEQFKKDPIFEGISFCTNVLAQQRGQLSTISVNQPKQRPWAIAQDVLLAVAKQRGSILSFCVEVQTDQKHILPSQNLHSKAYTFGAASIGQGLYTVSCNRQDCNHIISCGNVTSLMKQRLGSNDTFVDQIWEIDTSPLKANTCSKKANVISFKGKLYIVGGCTSYKGQSVDIQCYDPDEGEWKEMANMNTSRCRIGAVATSNYIYAVGGVKSHITVSEKVVERYNPDTNEWTTMADMWYSRDAPHVLVSSDSIFAIGGSVYNSLDSCRCEVYKESCDQWSVIADLPKGYPVISLPLSDEVYAIAGRSTWKYSKEEDKWKKSEMFKSLENLSFDDYWCVPLKLTKFSIDKYHKIASKEVDHYEYGSSLSDDSWDDDESDY